MIGGGVSGLATAFRAREAAAALGHTLAVTVLEAASRPGGKMRTDLADGLVIEEGPNGFLDSKPDPLLLTQAIGLESRLLRSSDAARKRFVCRDGRLVRLPETPGAFLRSPLLSGRGKVRLLGEPFAPPAPPGEETLSEFAERRLGAEARDYLIDPMVSGIYAGDPARLSVAAAFPRVVELEREHGGLFRGMVAVMRQRRRERRQGPKSYAGPGGTLQSYRGGVATLPAALAASIGGPRAGGGDGLVLSTAATGIRRTATGWEVMAETDGAARTFPADAVVLSCPAYDAARLLRIAAPGAVEPLGGIPYAPVAVVATAFARDEVARPLDGFGFLIPGTERRPILGTLWDSSVFEDRAPPGMVLLRSMAGGARRPDVAEMPDSDLVAIVRAQLADLMGIRAAPRLVRVYRWDRGIPQYDLGHLGRVAAAEAALAREPGLFLCHNAYRGIALADCCREAAATGRNVASFLFAQTQEAHP